MLARIALIGMLCLPVSACSGQSTLDLAEVECPDHFLGSLPVGATPRCWQTDLREGLEDRIAEVGSVLWPEIWNQAPDAHCINIPIDAETDMPRHAHVRLHRRRRCRLTELELS